MIDIPKKYEKEIIKHLKDIDFALYDQAYNAAAKYDYLSLDVKELLSAGKEEVTTWLIKKLKELELNTITELESVFLNEATKLKTYTEKIIRTGIRKIVDREKKNFAAIDAAKESANPEHQEIFAQAEIIAAEEYDPADKRASSRKSSEVVISSYRSRMIRIDRRVDFENATKECLSDEEIAQIKVQQEKDLTIKDLANHLNVSESTIRRQGKRITEKLRKTKSLKSYSNEQIEEYLHSDGHVDKYNYTLTSFKPKKEGKK